ncbi:MAG TPA: hypothetical protein VK517_11615 [Cyclobacteriaceae bacterium]|nr:hypothetical protein [Cyclobacteriaceae bacterium]
MKKLEDIPKKNIFDVPEGYFDRLPEIIQSRISVSPAPVMIHSWTRALRYALPLTAFIAAGIFWYQNYSSSFSARVDVESELASIHSDQLAAYLDDHELTTEDLVETVNWSSDELNDLENAVYFTPDVTHRQLEEILDESN